MNAISEVHALSPDYLGLATGIMEKEKVPLKSKVLRQDRKPWPMWPIAVSILTFIVFYTWVQLSFRKTERPYEPNRAMKERYERVTDKNLYGWYSLSLKQTTEEITISGAKIHENELTGPLENEIPSQIVYYLPRKPILVPKLSAVFSNPDYKNGRPLALGLKLPKDFANSPSFHLTALYKGSELILLPEMRVENAEKLAGLNLESPSETLYFLIETQPIESERIQAKLLSAEKSYSWQLNRASENPSEY